MDSNHRRYKPADLQSAPFGHSGILPYFSFLFRNHFVSHRIVGQSFTMSKLLPSSLDFLVLSENKLQIFIIFPKSLRQSSYRRSVIYKSKLLSSSLDFLVLSENKLQNFHIFSEITSSVFVSSIDFLFVSKNFEPMEGIEPTTPRLQITCSSQLSYIGETS